MATYISRKNGYRNRYKQLVEAQLPYRQYWTEIQKYMLPRKGRYLTSLDEQSNNGARKDYQILNGIAKEDLRILAAGMQGGLTSPSRPWFSLTLDDEDLMEFAPVKQWLQDVRRILLSIYAKSNFYAAVHSMYLELGAFGTGSILQFQDFKSVSRFRPLTIGEYCLVLDELYRTVGMYRQYAMTAENIVAEFGKDNVSHKVRTAVDTNHRDKMYELVHLIVKNEDVDPRRKDFKGMPFSSVYFEVESTEEDMFLRDSGFRTTPIAAIRWDTTGVDTYGNSLGMDLLGDVKQLQKMEEKKLKALDKVVDPPMNAPTGMKGSAVSVVAGDVNFYDQATGFEGFGPTYQIKPDFAAIGDEIDRVETRVHRGFFRDLFLMISNTQGQKTATEIVEKKEEKLIMLGPVVERLQSEFLDPTVDRTFSIAQDLGILPPPPREIQGMEYKVSYLGLLAQAQKLLATSSIENVVSFAGNLAGVKPDVLDKIDFDEAIDQYADMQGTPAKIVRPDDQVKIIRENRAQAEATQAAQENLANGVQAAKLLSETQLDTGSALDVARESIS